MEEHKSQKVKEMNKKHQEILMAQMAAKNKGKKANMNNTELALNKKKLRQVKYQEQAPQQEVGGLEVVGQNINS